MQTKKSITITKRWAAMGLACLFLTVSFAGCPFTPKTKPDFMAWPVSGAAPLTVQFIDISQVAPGETVLRWWWDFGDNGFDVVQDPIHVYTQPNQYDVKLILETLAPETKGNTGVLHTRVKKKFISVTTPGATPGDAIHPGEMVSISASAFNMGATDAEAGAEDEYPRHRVTLSAYEIGKFEVTNKEFADALNALLDEGLIVNETGGAYAGGDVYAYGKRVLAASSGYCQIAFAQNRFEPKVRDGRSMENHPVVMVTWYGAVVFCNRLSQSQGLAPYYNLATWSPAPNGAKGFRLPTEAEWERAAAWDASPSPSRWIYGFSSNNIDFSRCNYAVMEEGQAAYYPNPIGLSLFPYTTPIGYYNGTNGTLNRRSPAGCYDMSGNVLEWCGDRYGLYTEDEQTNPAGPAYGGTRVVRGGSWFQDADACRTAHRASMRPDRAFMFLGFRTARTP
ncbi:MAG TPA: SUMF1/EgtB/PvdO family nonheme iron enzyme [Candidatus Hydrogenedentes bacterium]|nr:SUMF1/EgtB/PvdO family nonheme iron enzyme [Candidatus Hydrogenedentota bacterium]